MRPAHSAEGLDVSGSQGFVNNIEISWDIYQWIGRNGNGSLLSVIVLAKLGKQTLKGGTNVKAFKTANAVI